jgi:hypothetical protein
MDSTTKQEWVDACLRFARCNADLWSRDQKILRQRRITFHTWDNSLTSADVGYTGAKLKTLERHYLHNESRDAAVQLWEHIRWKGNYKSAAFSCANHVFKNGASFEEARKTKVSMAAFRVPACKASSSLYWRRIRSPLTSHTAARRYSKNPRRHRAPARRIAAVLRLFGWKSR